LRADPRLSFRFDLALELGIPVGELSDRMTALEETYWHAHCADKPLPTQQLVMHIAQVSQYIQMVNAKREDRGKLTDFLLFFKKRQTPQKNVDQEILNVFGKLKQDK
jgi:hypothetical protein